jgi:hypothetical protein
MAGLGFTVGGLHFAVGGFLVVGWWFVDGSASIFRSGANGIRLRQAYGATGSMGLMGPMMLAAGTANGKPQTANCKPLSFFCVVESAVVNGETAAPMFGVDLNKSAVP